jgi:hypothetical protein
MAANEVLAAEGRYPKASALSRKAKVNLVRSVEDFIITGSSKELSAEKTHITRIEDGFDFLGPNVRDYGGTILVKPITEECRDVPGESPGDHQGQQACHRRTPDREPQLSNPRLGELSSSRGQQADLLTTGLRDRLSEVREIPE